MNHRLRVVRRALWRIGKWPLAVFAVIVLLLLLPVGYVELACRGDGDGLAYQPLITDSLFQRTEANTYLTYPEWHIVYAYDGLAEALKTGDEYAFDYASSVSGFWSSTCGLMAVADAHGGASADTRAMIHTIGVSFTAEMAAKAAYEETIGRVFAWWRGQGKTPQDRAIAATAADYAAFLRQTPWYRYPFRREAGRLWDAPMDGFFRGWERRFGIGVEFLAKAAYAQILASAAAAAPAQLVIRTIVTGLEAPALATIPEVKVVTVRAEGVEIETPRYDLFTRILFDISQRGGRFVEIAGNDDIMVTLRVPTGRDMSLPHGRQILRMKREGFASDRILVDAKVSDLAALLNAFGIGDPGVEHVFDY